MCPEPATFLSCTESNQGLNVTYVPQEGLGSALLLQVLFAQTSKYNVMYRLFQVRHIGCRVAGALFLQSTVACDAADARSKGFKGFMLLLLGRMELDSVHSLVLHSHGQ